MTNQLDHEPSETSLEEHADRSLPQLLAEMTRDMSLLVRKEVELAKVEAKEQAARLGKGVGMFAGAGAFGYLSLLILSFAGAFALAQVVDTWLAFLAVGLFHLVITVALVLMGKKQLKAFTPVPEQTVETLKEDVQWAKNRNS